MLYVRLPSMSQEDLETYNQQLKEKKEKYLDVINTFPKNQDDYSSSEWTMYADYQEVNELLWNIKIELVRREEKLEEKDDSELHAISNEAYRRVSRMQNYDWDVVEGSSEENRRGFWTQVDYLEILQSAANLEFERRQYVELHS